MLFMADTNILLRFVSPSDPNHILVRDAIYSLLQRGEEICYTSQILGEFWNVCTRPTTARSGFGLSIEETDQRAQVIKRYFNFLPDSAAVHTQWRRLVVDYRVSGVKVHDTRLVAAMLVHGLTHILTFNDSDFARYLEITGVHPKDITP
ncbi:PIN domain-containing protein [Nostoc sp. CENA67]|uniref:PIN domain-containing protein n=1 Tax=Amazonocrinis nigriterrae CENA67 TaxID=2794033 RepID=A0A8J7HXK3_9NOST|nr:PIN domain-containing protein [Amazonocrinis nigriterrae]MBH8565503.1 PIN domain-containing protein [Amazonocrinis nigriterrae CENA67]